LQTHVNGVHLKIKNHLCDHCDRRCISNAELRSHVDRVHLKIKNHLCDHCDQKCSSKHDLQTHINGVHLKIKKYACDQCDQKFSQSGALRTHINGVHLKIKKYACDQCDYKSTAKATLQIHINAVHLCLKKYACDQCDYKGVVNSKLQEHIDAVHLGIKNHACDQCDYKSNTNATLQKHIISCTGETKCSAGEFQVMKTLDAMGIIYTYNSSYELKSKGWLRWDFRIDTREAPGFTRDNMLFIEYNGQQHYDAVSCWGGEEAFVKIQDRDKLKDDYCKDNEFDILWIHYDDFAKIDELVTDFMTNIAGWKSTLDDITK